MNENERRLRDRLIPIILPIVQYEVLVSKMLPSEVQAAFDEAIAEIKEKVLSQSTSGSLWQRVRREYEQYGMIHAVKMYRENINAGLKECKECIERRAALENWIRNDSLGPYHPPRRKS